MIIKFRNTNQNTNNQTSQTQQHLADLSTEELQNRLDELILNESMSIEDASLVDLYCKELDSREGADCSISSELSLDDFYQKNMLILDDEFPTRNLAEKPVKHFSVSRYFAIAAAIIVVVGLLATQVLGLNLWNAIAQWTNDVFGFSYQNIESSSDYSEQSNICSDLHYAISSEGIDVAVVPTYLPDGFVQIEFYEENNPLAYTSVYQNDDATIVIQIIEHTPDMVEEFQKEAGQPEVYVQNEVEHYIMDNTGTYFAVWINAGLECSITGVPTLDEMYKIIDSIY